MTHLTTPPNSLLTIDARFNGPARSGHGGVSGGRFAALVDARRAIVDFLAPIPLDEPLSGTRQGEAAHVDGPDGPVAAVTRLAGPLPTGPFGRLAAGEVARAEASWLDARDGDHVAPTCFACGHRRTDDSGLGLRPGPVAGLALFATSWRPGLAGDVPPWLVWAALDCPTGVPAMADVGPDEAVVTARLAVDIRDRVPGSGDYQLVSRRTGGRGRKHLTEAALVDEDGRSLAVASAVWITVPITVMQPDRRTVAQHG